MAEHSPLPWELAGPWASDIISGDTLVGSVEYSGFSVEEDAANAAYIVKACNAFPDMLTALEAVAECKSLFELNQAMPSVLAAIQKAKVA